MSAGGLIDCARVLSALVWRDKWLSWPSVHSLPAPACFAWGGGALARVPYICSWLRSALASLGRLLEVSQQYTATAQSCALMAVAQSLLTVNM